MKLNLKLWCAIVSIAAVTVAVTSGRAEVSPQASPEVSPPSLPSTSLTDQLAPRDFHPLNNGYSFAQWGTGTLAALPGKTTFNGAKDASQFLVFDQSGIYPLKQNNVWYFAIKTEKAQATSHIFVVLLRYLSEYEKIEPKTAVHVYRAQSQFFCTQAGNPVKGLSDYAFKAQVAGDFYAAHSEKTLVDTNGKLGVDWHVFEKGGETTWKSSPQLAAAMPDYQVEHSFIQEQLKLNPDTCHKSITAWLFPDKYEGGRAIFSLYYNNAKGAYLWISSPDEAFHKHYFLKFTPSGR